jgi:hypothetical protein
MEKNRILRKNCILRKKTVYYVKNCILRKKMPYSEDETCILRKKCLTAKTKLVDVL